MTHPRYAQLMRQERGQDRGPCPRRTAPGGGPRGGDGQGAGGREMDIVDTGGFAASWRGEDRGDSAAAVVNTKPYAPYVDDGQPPGNPPPLAVLVRWVERRLRLGGHQAWAAARTIQQHIAERGITAAEITKWLRGEIKASGPKKKWPTGGRIRENEGDA